MTPPSKSNITSTIDRNGHTVLTLPASSGFIRYFVAAFLICWLFGWAAGLVGSLHEVITDAKAPKVFLIAWLGGWSIGGCFAIAMLYRMLRPAIPESLTLSMPELGYDTGVPPMDFMSFNRQYYRSQTNPWKKVFQRRKIVIFSPSDISTLKLRDVEGGNRLTIDKENERIDLGQTLTEVEREWLFAQLKAAYRL
jgi:hypothetical protein